MSSMSISALARASKILLLLVLGLGFGAGGVKAASVAGQDVGKPTVLAIVDVQKILQTSKAAKSVQEQLDRHSSKFQSEIADEEKELREAERELAKLREKASAQDYIHQEQELQKRFMTVERRVQARRKALDQGFSESMNEVRQGLVRSVADIAKERGVHMAIVKQQVIWNDQAIDITDEVMARMDKMLPAITVNIPPDEEIIKKQEEPLGTSVESKKNKSVKK